VLRQAITEVGEDNGISEGEWYDGLLGANRARFQVRPLLETIHSEWQVVVKAVQSILTCREHVHGGQVFFYRTARYALDQLDFAVDSFFEGLLLIWEAQTEDHVKLGDKTGTVANDLSLVDVRLLQEAPVHTMSDDTVMALMRRSLQLEDQLVPLREAAIKAIDRCRQLTGRTGT
jgi:hypothetical protein